MEVDPNLLFAALAGIGAIVTAVATLIKLYYIDIIKPQRKKRRIEEKKALLSKIRIIEVCVNSLKNSLNWVRNNEFKKREYPDISYPQLLSETLKQKVDQYVARYFLCGDLYKACEYAIKHFMRVIAITELPETREKYQLDSPLTEDKFMRFYVNDQEPSTIWLRTQDNKLYHRLLKKLNPAEGEEALDRFFREVSQIIKNDRVFNRFRKEKETSIVS